MARIKLSLLLFILVFVLALYETESELVVKADLPDLQEKDIDVRVENNTLTIRGKRKFEKDVSEDNYLRVERAYGSLRSFSLSNTVKTDSIRGEYRNGALTVRMAKREESKAKQVKINLTGMSQETASKLNIMLRGAGAEILTTKEVPSVGTSRSKRWNRSPSVGDLCSARGETERMSRIGSKRKKR